MIESENSTGICNLGLNLSDPAEVPAIPSNMQCSGPEYYGFLYGVVGTICQTIVFLVGVVGNLVVVVTVKATKSLHTTTNCYLVSLALADLITLLSSVPQVLHNTHHQIQHRSYLTILSTSLR